MRLPMLGIPELEEVELEDEEYELEESESESSFVALPLASPTSTSPAPLPSLEHFFSLILWGVTLSGSLSLLGTLLAALAFLGLDDPFFGLVGLVALSYLSLGGAVTILR
jgi:hypothetical protein